MIECQGLHAAAAPGLLQPVLHDIALHIAPGEQLALIGPSGAGKTTLLHSLALAQPPLAGQLYSFGTQAWRLSRTARHKLRAELCLAPQQSPMPPRQRVVTAVLAGRLPRQNLWQSLRTLWNPPEAALAYQALQALDLGDKLWLRVDALSGGERQRVGLARLLVSEARLWLADEPLAGLDPRTAELALGALQSAAAAQGRTLVCSLHQVELARRCFGRVVALRAGRICYDGPGAQLSDALVAELYAGAPAASPEPVHPSVALPQAMCR